MSARLTCVHPVLMTRDVPRSVAFFENLGFTEAFRDDPDQPRYAGVRRDGVELHLQWHDAAEWDYPNDRPTYRFVVADVDELHAELTEPGMLERVTEVMDTPWGTRESHVLDPDGNGLQFYRDL